MNDNRKKLLSSAIRVKVVDGRLAYADQLIVAKAFEAGQSQRDKVIDQILRRLDGLEIQKK